MAKNPLRWFIGPPEAEIRAAYQSDTSPATSPGPMTGWGTGMDRLAPFTWAPPIAFWWNREAAMSIPTISRARNLICSAVGSLPLIALRLRWDAPTGQVIEERQPPPQWFGRPDPTKTRNWTLAWTCDDLIFHGRAFWRVSSRYSTNYPASFQRMPYTECRIDHDGQLWWKQANWGTEVAIPDRDLVEFLSPIEGLLAFGHRAISTALQLDAAAQRYSACDTPSGWLKQTGGEPMSAEELGMLAQAWHEARMRNATGALNDVTDYQESSLDPSKLQLVEARQYQALELARLANVPPYLVGAPAGTGMTYQNAQQARSDLIDFGAMPYVNCIEQTLSGPNVMPNGNGLRLDLNAWLRSPLTEGQPSPNDLSVAYNQDTTQGVSQDA